MAASDPGHGAELFVADGRNNRIAVFSLDQLTSDAAARGPGGEGDLLVPFTRTIGGGPSAILGRFNGPSGVHVHKETLYVSELGGERVQLLTLAGLPLQAVLACGPCSGVCADDEHVCATTVDGGHAITLWTASPQVTSLTPLRDAGSSSYNGSSRTM